jgi:molybdopterin converting factor small subunit
MPKVILKGFLKNILGKNEIEAESSDIFSLITELNLEKILINDRKRLKGGFLILLNGRDIRLYDINKIKFNKNDIIEIIPINHGG